MWMRTGSTPYMPHFRAADAGRPTVVGGPPIAANLTARYAGTAQKAAPVDSVDYMRAVVPLIAGTSRFIIGTMGEQRGLDWVIPPSEPVEKAEEDKNRPPDAPTLRRPVKP